MRAPRRSAPDLEQMSLFTPESASPPWSALSAMQRAAIVRLLGDLLASPFSESTPCPEDGDDER